MFDAGTTENIIYFDLSFINEYFTVWFDSNRG